MKILTIGGATKDLFLHYKYPESLQVGSDQDNIYTKLPAGRKIEISKVEQFLGGGAINTAASFSKLDIDATVLCKVGNDPEGQHIVQALTTLGIATNLVNIDNNTATATSFIMPCTDGDSTLLVYRGANTHLQEKDIPHTKLSEFNQLYLSSLNGEAAQLVKPITDAAKKLNIPVAINPGMAQLCETANIIQESLPNISTFILNACEAKEFMLTLIKDNKLQGVDKKTMAQNTPELLQPWIEQESSCFNLGHYFKEILSRGPSIAIVTNGSEGVYVAHHDTIYFHPSIATNIVSTVGAGDAFGSCFVGSIMKGHSVEQALIQGILNSLSVLQYEGAQEGLLTMSTLEENYSSAPKNLIQKFAL
ncbi:carbohydrate kinase family protein [bacterium]|jgi:sugar/nucleoside kinase (ribokinase family)|nr:carbohydrate kinase family protein [bacterium]MBT5015632.1 carbohydrate kinase family protein [bacterium]